MSTFGMASGEQALNIGVLEQVATRQRPKISFQIGTRQRPKILQASGKQATQHTGKQPGEGSVGTTSRDTAAAEGEVHPDAPFAAALGAIPFDDWGRTWAAGRTFMLRRTSKRIKEVVDKMHLPAIVRLSRSFWDDARNGTAAKKRQFVMRQLTVVTAVTAVNTIELPRCEMKGQGAKSLARVLAQCAALAHLNLCGNRIEAAGAESLARVLSQCPALAHLNLDGNGIGPAGAESLAAVLAQCRSLAHLDLCNNDIGPDGAESLAGVLGQCAALAHLKLSNNKFGAEVIGRIAGPLVKCRALASLDLSLNYVGEDEIDSILEVLKKCPQLANLKL
jgi:hypothetical protein